MGRAEDIAELKALSTDPDVPEEVKAKVVDKLWALADAPAQPSGAVIDQPPTPGKESELGGIKAVYGNDWTPYGAGGQPISQTGDDRARDEAAMASEANRVASMLDPRFSIVPQVLALQPATNHPGGDQAAKAAIDAGQRPIVIYEPTVDSVRRHLYENPALLRVVSDDHVPTAQEIQNLTHDSALYQSAADWMYKQANDVATEKGVPIVRYRDAPWATLDPKQFSLKVDAADPEAANRFQAFVLGADDTGTLGIGRANQELTEPGAMLTQQTRLGVNASVPHPSREVNAWTEEEYPLEYGAGQVLGMLSPRSVGARLWEMLEAGSLAARAAAGRAITGTRLGAAAAEMLSPGVKAMGGVAADAATGGVAASATQAGQEVVDAAARGEMPDLAEAGERVKDAGFSPTGGATFGALGSATRRGSHSVAEEIRDSPRYSDQYGRGLVRQAEPNLEWGPMSVIAGTRPNAATRELVNRSSKGGYIPSDSLAEEIAGPVGRAAADNARVSADRAGAARAGYHVSPEGRQPVPVKQALDEALRGTASHYQPEAGGRLRAVNDRPPPEQKVFNSLVGDVSTSATGGATKLTPEQAGTFLPLRTQVKLLKDDLEQASRNRAGKPDDRAAYLAGKPARARDGIDAEIEDDIEDLIGFDKHGVPRTVDKRSAEYKEAQQQVIRSRVDAETVLEPFGGSLAEYLKQRGIDAVYVTPRTLDAERLDRLIELHGADSKIGKAAAFDRRQLSAGGKKGGYHEMLGQQQDEAARHAKVAERVAPGGDAFRPIAGLYQAHPGEKQLVDDVRDLADQAGVRNQLDRMRGLQSTAAVANRSRGADALGHPRSGGRLNPINYGDMLPLRAFPILRSLEGPLGPLEGATLGRLGLVGGSETADARARDQAGPRGRYEAARDRRIKEIREEKAREAADAERRQVETMQKRRR